MKKAIVFSESMGSNNRRNYFGRTLKKYLKGGFIWFDVQTGDEDFTIGKCFLAVLMSCRRIENNIYEHRYCYYFNMGAECVQQLSWLMKQ